MNAQVFIEGLDLKNLSDDTVRLLYTNVFRDVLYEVARELDSRGIDTDHLIITMCSADNGYKDVGMSTKTANIVGILLDYFGQKPEVYFALMAVITSNSKELTDKYARLVFQKIKEQAGDSVEDMLKEVFNQKTGKGDE